MAKGKTAKGKKIVADVARIRRRKRRQLATIKGWIEFKESMHLDPECALSLHYITTQPKRATKRHIQKTLV
jgi:hypothetical protein